MDAPSRGAQCNRPCNGGAVPLCPPTSSLQVGGKILTVLEQNWTGKNTWSTPVLWPGRNKWLCQGLLKGHTKSLPPQRWRYIIPLFQYRITSISKHTCLSTWEVQNVYVQAGWIEDWTNFFTSGDVTATISTHTLQTLGPADREMFANQWFVCRGTGEVEGGCVRYTGTSQETWPVFCSSLTVRKSTGSVLRE